MSGMIEWTAWASMMLAAASPSLTGRPDNSASRIIATQLPLLMLKQGDGSITDVRQLTGRPLLVEFWASWCAPCTAGLVELQRLRCKHAADRLGIVPVSLDRGGPSAAVRGYARANITHLPLYVVDADIAVERFAIGGLPLTILFDANGRELARFDARYPARDGAIRRAVARELARSPQPRHRP